MRNLRSFLLEEIALSEGNEEEKQEENSGVPEVYKKIGSRGVITTELKELLNIASAKELNLKKKNNSYMKISTKDGRESIRTDLGLQPGGSYFDVLKKLAKSENLQGVFTGASQGSSSEIKLQLTSSYKEIAGKLASSKRFIKFWCQCACIACGLDNAPDELEFYVSEEGKGTLLLVKEK